jgi:peptidyl-prolyl cis-trans isomerase SurA
VARQNQIDVVELRRRLAADGMSVAQFRDELRSQMLLARRARARGRAQGRVTDLEVDQFIQEQQGNNDLSTMELNLGADPGRGARRRHGSPGRCPAGARPNARWTGQAPGEDFARWRASSPTRPALQRRAGRWACARPTATRRCSSTRSRPCRKVASARVHAFGRGFHVLKVIEKRQAGMPGINVTQSRVRHILLRPTAQLGETAALERSG